MPVTLLPPLYHSCPGRRSAPARRVLSCGPLTWNVGLAAGRAGPPSCVFARDRKDTPMPAPARRRAASSALALGALGLASLAAGGTAQAAVAAPASGRVTSSAPIRPGRSPGTG